MKGLEQIREEIRKDKSREASRYTQAETAKALGISVPTLRSYERDPSRMPIQVARQLADHLGVDLADIFLLADGN